MNKKSLVYEVSQKTGYSQTQVYEILGPAFDIIKETLGVGGKIKISRFGTFEVKNVKERNSRNPATGEPILIEQKEVVKFKPSPTFLKKDSIS